MWLLILDSDFVYKLQYFSSVGKNKKLSAKSILVFGIFLKKNNCKYMKFSSVFTQN